MIPMGNTCRKRAASAILYPRKDGMDMERPKIERLLASPWGEADPTLAALKASEYGKELQKALALLDREALYESWMHGAGHIERVMVLSAELAREGALPLRETELLLLAASYHDIGRSRDGLDFEHGSVAARFIGLVTGRTGEDLLILKGAVDAHSRKESQLDGVLDQYRAADRARAKNIAQLLKDADGLDRVRIWDLDVKFLRRASSVKREAFAQELYNRYQPIAGLPLMPDFVPELLRRRGEFAHIWD